MRAKKNILFVAHDSKVEGGANRSLMSIIDYMNSTNKYKILVLVPQNKGEFIEWLEQKKIRYIVAKYKWQLVGQNGNRILKSLKLAFLFVSDFFIAFCTARMLKKEKIDIIYTNTRVVYIGNFLSMLLKTPHIMHCREFINEVMHRKAIFFSESFLNATTTKFIYISEAMRKVYVSLDKNKAEIVYNGIPILSDDAVINHEKLLCSGTPKILLTGRIGEVKGQLDAIQAINILRDKYQENVIIYLAGSGGDSSYNKVLSKYIENNALKERVVFLGEVKNMSFVRNTVDIELVCSRFEAFGRVTIEAMNNGLPLIGANAPATDEIICDEVNGLLYEVNNPNDLARQIDRLIRDVSLRKKLIQNERKSVKNKYTDAIMLNHVERIIDAITGGES